MQLTGVDAGIGGRDAKLRLDEFGDEGDESSDDGAFRCVGQADEQEGHIAEDPHRCFGQVWKRVKTRGGGRREKFNFLFVVTLTASQLFLTVPDKIIS